MPIKLTTITERGKKRKKIQTNLQNKSKHKNNRCFSWVSAVRVLSLARSHSPPRLLGCPLTLSWSLALLWGSSDSNLALLLCLLLQCPQPSEPACLLSRARSVAAHLLHRHGVCLVDPVGLICSLCSWWAGSGSSSSATLPLGFTCGFISTSACGSSTGVCSWDCLGGLGSAPVKARGGGGAAAWVAGILAAPGARGGGG